MSVLATLARGLVAVLWFVLRVLVHGWATLAIYFSNLPSAPARTTLAVAFFVFGIWALWIARRRAALVVYAALYVAVLAWWATILPSNDREWRPEVAVMPRAYIDGDRVRITGVRDFDYRSRDDFTSRYVEREVSLSHLTAVDFYISFWMPGPIGHTFVSFVFDNAPPLAVSIETRPEAGEGYSPLASLFKHYELIYVVGTERDIVGVRTNYRDEDVYLYRIRVSPENARRLFLVYLERINELAGRPEWYHLLSNSCTINIVRYANLAGRVGGLDFRHILNGWIDRYFFETGYVDNRLPFAELRRRSQINAAARAADSGRDFPERIRAGLPTMTTP
jgi:uncharacterized protein DUF4105